MRSRTFLGSEGKDPSESEWVSIGLYNILTTFKFLEFYLIHFYSHYLFYLPFI